MFYLPEVALVSLVRVVVLPEPEEEPLVLEVVIVADCKGRQAAKGAGQLPRTDQKGPAMARDADNKQPPTCDAEQGRCVVSWKQPPCSPWWITPCMSSEQPIAEASTLDVACLLSTSQLTNSSPLNVCL